MTHAYPQGTLARLAYGLTRFACLIFYKKSFQNPLKAGLRRFFSIASTFPYRQRRKALRGWGNRAVRRGGGRSPTRGCESASEARRGGSAPCGGVNKVAERQRSDRHPHLWGLVFYSLHVD